MKRHCNCNQLRSIRSWNWQDDSKNGEKGTRTGGSGEAQPGRRGDCLGDRERRVKDDTAVLSWGAGRVMICLQKKQKAKEASLCVWKETEKLGSNPQLAVPLKDPNGSVQLGHSGQVPTPHYYRSWTPNLCVKGHPGDHVHTPDTFTSSASPRHLKSLQVSPSPLPQLHCEPSAGPAPAATAKASFRSPCLHPCSL